MGKLRISIVEFLNTAPLVWGFTDGPLAGKYDLSFAVPSQCAEDLRAGRADVGIIPSIEYQRMENVVALPGMAIAAKNEVRSLLVVSKVPIELAKSLRSTRIRAAPSDWRGFSASHWNIEPEFIDMPPIRKKCWPVPMPRWSSATPRCACGLKWMRCRQNTAAEAAVAAAARMNSPSRALRPIFLRYGAAVARNDGPPGVLAIWVARRGVLTPEMVADFQASREYGLSHIGDIAEGAALKLDLPPRDSSAT